MKKLVIGWLFVFLFVPQVASADVPVPDTKSIEYCFKLTNSNDFPDYTLLKTEWLGNLRDLQVIEQDKCYSTGYKFNQVLVYAVNNEDWDEGLLDDWDRAVDWFETSGKARPINVSPVNYVDLLSSVTKIEDVITISKLDATAFLASNDRVELTDVGERVFSDEEDMTDKVYSTSNLTWIYWVIGVLVLLIIGAAALLLSGWGKDNINN